ncbi:hypothetical protein HOD75_00205 [archaeon]|jgi:hypothetical protein|nr:hypothetical protein [archaeon]MBT4241299.1 hypothetical protein [archaeon]MBT4418121.1 hypothetical protein [archaeon]
MVWQDIVIAIANVLFGYSLIYQVYLGFKKRKGFLAIQTSFLTTIGLYAIAFAFLTMNLYISALVSVFNGTLWLILFIQRLIYKKA